MKYILVSQKSGKLFPDQRIDIEEFPTLMELTERILDFEEDDIYGYYKRHPATETKKYVLVHKLDDSDEVSETFDTLDELFRWTRDYDADILRIFEQTSVEIS